MADYNSSHVGNDIDTAVDAVQAAVAANGIVNVKGLNTILGNYLTSSSAANTYLTQSDAVITYLPLAGGTLAGNLTIFGDLRHDTRNIIIRPNDFPIVENCASYYTDTSTVTGTFKITLPLNNGDCVMQILEVYIYDYSSQAGSRLLISGYSYINKDWYNYACKVQGNYNKGCRMAFDSTNYCILLGTTSTSWNYPKLWLAKWIGGYSNRMSIVDKGLPTISLITSESGYTITGSAS